MKAPRPCLRLARVSTQLLVPSRSCHAIHFSPDRLSEHTQESVKVPLYRIYSVESPIHWVPATPGGNLERKMITGGAREVSGRYRIRRPTTPVAESSPWCAALLRSHAGGEHNPMPRQQPRRRAERERST